MKRKIQYIVASIICICIFISIPIIIYLTGEITRDNAAVTIPCTVILSLLITHTIAGEIYLQTGFFKYYFYNILGWDEEVIEFDNE